jgi:transcriptional regulator with XRE-family HTH domain
MKVNERIRRRREELGFNLSEVARFARIGVDAYRDVERYENEAFAVATLGTMRAICGALTLDMLSLFNIICPPQQGDEVGQRDLELSRNVIISAQRNALGLTREELGNRIGFETIAIDQMENEPDFLEQWSIELIENLASELRLPICALVGA